MLIKNLIPIASIYNIIDVPFAGTSIESGFRSKRGSWGIRGILGSEGDFGE